MMDDRVVTGREKTLPLAVAILTFSAFTIGTSEFAVLGLLPEVAESLSISIPRSGFLISAYALGVAIGGPIMAVLTARMVRKRALLLLMAIFILGNALCVVASSFETVLIARVITALGQGAFFGVGAVVASGLVSERRQASAIAAMFAGVTLANVFGVPAGTALGHWVSWRVPFLVIACLGLVSFVALALTLPRQDDGDRVSPRDELRGLVDARIWFALLTTVAFATTIFILFSYLSPFASQVAGLTPSGVSLTLMCVGLGMALGSFVGGRLADWRLAPAMIGVAIAIGVASLTLRWTGSHAAAAELNFFAWGITTFAAIPTTQVNVMRFGRSSPNLASTLNIASFNAGIALGSWIGGLVLAHGVSLAALPIAAAVCAIPTTVMATICGRLGKSTVSAAEIAGSGVPH